MPSPNYPAVVTKEFMAFEKNLFKITQLDSKKYFSVVYSGVHLGKFLKVLNYSRLKIKFAGVPFFSRALTMWILTFLKFRKEVEQISYPLVLASLELEALTPPLRDGAIFPINNTPKNNLIGNTKMSPVAAKFYDLTQEVPGKGSLILSDLKKGTLKNFRIRFHNSQLALICSKKVAVGE